MDKNKFIKLHAAFKSGFLGNNIMETYYPFFASIIYTNKYQTIDEYVLQKDFMAKYNFTPTIPFIRQVLSIGLENNSIKSLAGKFVPDFPALKAHIFDSSQFDQTWSNMVLMFQQFCIDFNSSYDPANAADDILKYIEQNDYQMILPIEINTNTTTTNSFEYQWIRFISELKHTDKEMLNFISAISASNIYKEALFYEVSETDTFDGLNVYLDTPMVFALLGMDSRERANSYQLLIKDMVSFGCNVYILDNNFTEISGIIERSSNWARSSSYSIAKANKVAKYLHDLELTTEESIEFCESLEDKLNELNITIKATHYNIQDASFQEDELTLFNMVKDKYDEQNMGISAEKSESIATDVRSIIMIYNERQGRTAVKVQKCGHVLLTINSVLANVSKKYESNQSINSGHIPACISADLFGALLWMFTPQSNLEYHKNKLLADCYAALQPNQKLLDRYMESLESAKNSGEIEEKKYLFMRSHSLVSNALMNVTKGDYARFNDKTYLEVWDDIQLTAQKQYSEEVAHHNETKEKAKQLDLDNQKIRLEHLQLAENFEKYKKQQQDKADLSLSKKSNLISRIISVFVLFIPYIIVVVLVKFMENTFMTSVTIKNILLVVATTLFLIFFKKIYTYINKWIYTKVHTWMKNKYY